MLFYLRNVPSLKYTDMTPEEKIKKLQEWLDDFPSWLSERADYARGYKAGILQARTIVNDIING